MPAQADFHVLDGAGPVPLWRGHRLGRTRRERQPGLLLSCDCESSSFGENDAKMREKTRHIIIASAAACDGCWQNRTHAFCICKARQPVRAPSSETGALNALHCAQLG